MSLLRRVLYLHALLAAVGGAGLVAVPRWLLVAMMGQPVYPDYTWVRLAGVQGLALAMLMVLVAHRADELWWWAWSFVVLTAGGAAVLTLQAAFGVPPGADAWAWWGLALASWAIAGGYLWGLARAGVERPIV